MSKRVQPHPVTAKSSLFHQVLINTMVVYALRDGTKTLDLVDPIPKSWSKSQQTEKGKIEKGCYTET
jgi:hypothetical protein